MAAIDKVFCSSNFEQKFPLAFVSTRARGHSDHVPLVLNLNCSERKKPSIFRFEKWWLEQPNFKDLVVKVWNTSCAFTDPVDVWQFKIRLLRKKTKGWSWNRNAEVKKLKQQLLKEFDNLDIKQEKGFLNQCDRDRMDSINKDLEAWWRLEEIKVRQRSREKESRKEIGTLLTFKQWPIKGIGRIGFQDWKVLRGGLRRMRTCLSMQCLFIKLCLERKNRMELDLVVTSGMKVRKFLRRKMLCYKLLSLKLRLKRQSSVLILMVLLGQMGFLFCSTRCFGTLLKMT